MPHLDKVESLFHQALALPPEVNLQQWLAAECTGAPWLFQEVSGFLEARARMNQASGATQPPPLPSAQFGAYRPLRLLGRGGMGAVYLAERSDGQFRQTAALKVMAGYLADQDFFRRFEAERQFLAMLNHHNIPRLLDGGVSSGGDPFLVMEYVDGQPIDAYCEQRTLSVEARLRIFLQVCDAVDYAHRNLIVHRDLKPANILVDQERVVKLLDFGTASLTAGAPNSPTVTSFRMITPRYASPEQIRGERVNTLTDVFSLGVVLYELMTSAWPFGDPNPILRDLPYASGHRSAIPPLRSITEETAKSRSTSRAQLSHALKGDLSAIMLKALESEPSRRYQSVRTLASDLESFLDGRPVSARAQTALYRTGKFLRRRWLAVTAAAVFGFGLAGAAVVAERQAQVARQEAAKAENVNRFLNDMLSSPRNSGFDPQKFTVAQMLGRAQARLEKNWGGDPRTEATLRRSLGTSFVGVMQFDLAKPQLEKSLARFRALHDEKEVAWTVFRIAQLADAEGRATDAVQGYEQTLEHLKHLGGEAPPVLVFGAKDGLANALSLVLYRRLPEARRLFDEAIALGTRDLSIPRVDLAGAMAHSGIMFQNEGKRDQAEAIYRQALAVGREEDPDGEWQEFPLFALSTLIAPKYPAEAAQLARQRYELMASHEGDDGATAVSKILWVRMRTDAGELADGASQVVGALDVVRKAYLPESMDRWFAFSSSAHVLNEAKQYKAAESVAREMLPILEANHLPETDGRRAESLFELGKALYGQKKNRQATEVLQKSAAIYDAAGPNYVNLARWVRSVLNEIK